ncbi:MULTISPECIES: type I DNA topoisomerase [Rhodococcus]|uniref:DNA topoisomerase 1 n=1 Tax=Rhodococcus oxybenzonivorans TaxID=1990687 RepID=A0AAE4UYS4_9NOCA|nr:MULTISPECIES: type I DNA topoisomerase [Rhodococcus]MDV7242771.1 type I DNA topoisomerase [Rhodococcus oxybenzonivorans]MDV7265558.1 type I DNA topoisomerase [Rhodococcus oxybenzonivorans]MDV7275175.1 type I DNA topoisomerase [Rhodococcus oxybenzonivorans]MDV7334970.1 type I DNA topoisomerase [Rhodococcus oxybenzonivorans]MDV7345124.1 type I DNA topoisomerase [Rhodococcus oxybenzonivorans]
MAKGDNGSAQDAAGASGQPRRLVIVESPTKARKIAPYLGKNYVVEASVGHIRDLPRGAADVPAKYKGEPWARLGVDVDHDFEPLYVVSPEKKSKVTELKGLLKDADELFLATDPDREGEAIAWHLLETLKPKIPVRRMVFHEITEPAIRAAADDTRELDTDLVDAQETRRILDRLYGYEVSPVLWKKVMPKLSAGRVQSVATRVIVQRERERMAFRSASYWDISATLDAGADASPRSFGARLVSVDGSRVASGRDFGSDGQLKTGTVTVLDEARAQRLAESLAGVDLTVSSAESKPYTRKPYPPFMTSTLQQEAGRKLRFTSERTMRIAQRLYENGYITYMRTDSTTLSTSAIAAARAQATELYGAEYVHASPRQYTRKVKNAQEAHEAIRPAGDVFQTPGQLHSRLDTDEFRLYELIWQRTVASQMADARGTTLTLRISGTAGTGEECTFSASGRTITFAGFLKAYVESVDEEAGGQSDDAESRLPVLVEGQAVTATKLDPDGHTTNPPARYTEASLIKTLEELGIGRPSTYSSIIKTILDRGYVYKRGSALVPSWVAFAVIGLLEMHFGRLVDFDFTAGMEDDLDAIAGGREQRGNWLSSFYFGGDHGAEGSVAREGGLKKMVGVNLEEIDAREVNSIRLFDDAEGREVHVRVGRFGPYLERMVRNPDDPEGDLISQRANLPDDLPPDELTPEYAEKLFSTPQEGRKLGVDPLTGHEIVAKEGRFGPYVTEILPEPEPEPEPAVVPVIEPEPAEGTTKTKTAAKKAPAKKAAKKTAGPKPRTGSLLKSMDLATVTLDDALKLLSLPRVVGIDPESKEEITVQNGRYGPYLKKGTDSRSLATEDQMFTVTLEEALKIYAEPKRRGRQASATPPLRELGVDSVSEKPMVIKDGRFGPYVTDGETNASLRKGDEVESITDARASELLAERRARGPVKKKAPAKKAPAKKAAAKKTAAKKAPAKKAAAKKAADKKA